MNSADQIIPWVTFCQIADPILITGQVIDFQRELDDEFGMGAASLLGRLVTESRDFK